MVQPARGWENFAALLFLVLAHLPPATLGIDLLSWPKEVQGLLSQELGQLSRLPWVKKDQVGMNCFPNPSYNTAEKLQGHLPCAHSPSSPASLPSSIISTMLPKAGEVPACLSTAAYDRAGPTLLFAVGGKE